MFRELLIGVLALCCLVFGCAMVRVLCMPVRRPRPVPVPRDPAGWGFLSDEERRELETAERGYADEAGTAALEWPELQIEAELREGAE